MPRHAIDLQLDLLSPLSVGTSIETAELPAAIPGSALRGAVASLYLNIGEATDDLFHLLFLDGATWPDLCSRERTASRPVPLTAMTCKRYPGFRGVAPENAAIPERPHGVDDTLVASEVLTLTGNGRVSLEHARCPRCTQQRFSVATVPMHGYAERRDAGRYTSQELRRAVTSTSAVDRLSGTSDGHVLHRPVFAAPARVGGIIHVQDERAATFVQEQLLHPGREFSIGSGRSHGLGLVRVRRCRSDVASSWPALTDRLDTLHQAIESAAPGTSRAPWRYVSITLQSDAILMDPFFRYRTTIEGTDIGVPLLQLRRAASQETRVGGWNAAAGLPKERATAISRGAVFLYRYPADHHQEVAAALAEAEANGCGERRAEGYGRFYINDPFHMEVHELWQS